jgi:hypothetical protein
VHIGAFGPTNGPTEAQFAPPSNSRDQPGRAFHRTHDLLAPVADALGERDQLAGAFGQRAVSWSSGHDDATPALEVDESFVPKRAERTKDCVAIDADFSGQALCRRQAITRTGLALRDCTPDLRGDLLVELGGALIPPQVDTQHGASQNSSIEDVVSTAPPERQTLFSEDEAQALFEEARRRTRRRRVRNAASAIVIALGLGGLAVAIRSSEDGTQTPRQAPRTAPLHMPGPTRLYAQLLAPGEPFVRIDPQSGKLSRLALETAGGDWLDRVTVTGGRLVWSLPTGTFSLPMQGGQRRKLAPVPFVVGSVPNRLWFLINHRRQSGPGRPTTVLQTTAAGRTVFTSRIRLRCRGLVAAALKATLLCQDGDALAVIDPATGAPVRRLPGVFPLATRNDMVAICSFRCGRLTIGTPDGVRARVMPPSGYRFSAGYDGAFSLDGSWLAVPVVAARAAADFRAFRIALVDMHTYRARVLDGPRLMRMYGKFTWSTRGRLYVASGRGSIQVWRPGDSRARLLRLPTHAQMLDLAAN